MYKAYHPEYETGKPFRENGNGMPKTGERYKGRAAFGLGNALYGHPLVNWRLATSTDWAIAQYYFIKGKRIRAIRAEFGIHIILLLEEFGRQLERKRLA